MSYQFEKDESIGQSVERVAFEQLDEAVQHTKAKGKLDDAVHDARVCFKKLRGLIRLVHTELGDNEYDRENIFYRDLNRRLSDIRDTTAMTEIFDKLVGRFADELSHDAFASLRRSLEKAKRKRQADKKRVLVEVRKKTVAARKRVGKWTIKNDNFSAVSKGLSRIYAQGRTGYNKAYEKRSTKAFHEWRKQAKYLWYQMVLLDNLWPKQLKRFADQIKKLVDYLSDDHDLAILRKRVLKEPLQEGHEQETLVALIDKRRAELQTEACFLGERIYAEKPKAFNQRFHEYWQAWRSEQNTNPIAAR